MEYYIRSITLITLLVTTLGLSAPLVNAQSEMQLVSLADYAFDFPSYGYEIKVSGETKNYRDKLTADDYITITDNGYRIKTLIDRMKRRDRQEFIGFFNEHCVVGFRNAGCAILASGDIELDEEMKMIFRISTCNNQHGFRHLVQCQLNGVTRYEKIREAVHPVTPETAWSRAGQRFSDLMRVIKRSEAFAQILPDPRGIGSPEPLDLLGCSRRDFNPPGQARHLARQWTKPACPICGVRSALALQHKDLRFLGYALLPLRECRTLRSDLSVRREFSGDHMFRPAGGRRFACSLGCPLGCV